MVFSIFVVLIGMKKIAIHMNNIIIDNDTSDKKVVKDFLTINQRKSKEKYTLYHLKKYIKSLNHKTFIFIDKNGKEFKSIMEVCKNNYELNDLLNEFPIEKYETQIEYWNTFFNKCKKLNFANKKLEYLDKRIDGEIFYNIKVNLNDIVGSDCKNNHTWLNLLSNCNRKNKSQPIHEIKKEVLFDLSKHDYSLIYADNKYYMSDGHNRIVFLKFYANLYNEDIYIETNCLIEDNKYQETTKHTKTLMSFIYNFLSKIH